MDRSDDELFAAWRAGNAAAGDTLVRRHYPSVLRFFEYRTGQAAEDLAQKTLAACAEGLGRFRGEGTFVAFLFGIARRQLLNHHRNRINREDRSRLDAPQEPLAKTGLSTIIARRDEQRLLMQALVSLPEELQTALVLFYWQGLKAREIGLALDCPTSTATTRIARARTVLREAIDTFGGSGSARQRLVADVDGWLRSVVAPLSG
ncbi:MAG: sigma-70 family RNA polymerase sigma factor [Myxococcota bacterium]